VQGGVGALAVGADGALYVGGSFSNIGVVPRMRLAKVALGGTGEPWEWPKILPMWWGYKNPVSGRQPSLFLPDCVPCDHAPGMSMTKHGYLLPPTDPVRSVD